MYLCNKYVGHNNNSRSFTYIYARVHLYVGVIYQDFFLKESGSAINRNIDVYIHISCS